MWFFHAVRTAQVGQWFRSRVELEGFVEDLWNSKLDETVCDWS